MLTIHYCPELNHYEVHNGQRKFIVFPEEIEEGGRYYYLKQAFDLGIVVHYE